MFEFATPFKYISFLLEGAGLTLLVSFAGIAIGMCVGLLAALLRMSQFAPLRFAGGLYIDILRSTPLLAQLIWIYFGLPILTGITLSPFETGVLGLGLYSGAYLAEVYRSGMLAVPQGQWQASRALGMTSPQMLRRVILPQAVVRVLPPMASLWISMLKDSFARLGHRHGGADLPGAVARQPDAAPGRSADRDCTDLLCHDLSLCADGECTASPLPRQVRAARTMPYEWHFEVLLRNWPAFAHGIGMTLLVCIVSMAGALVGGLAVAFGRLSSVRAVRAVSYCYTEFFRTTPFLVQLLSDLLCAAADGRSRA